MIPQLPKRAALVTLIFLGACSGSSTSTAPTTTAATSVVTQIVVTAPPTIATTTTIYYEYPVDFVTEFTQGCTDVGGSGSACSCVIELAQASITFEAFGEMVGAGRGELVAGEATQFEAGDDLLAMIETCKP